MTALKYPKHNDWIAPSILSADFANLGADIQAVLDADADIVHFDVMDNHYVPNLTFGPMICEALRRYGIQHLIDVHLMVSPVDDLIERFSDAGANIITFHPEASLHVDRSIKLAKSKGVQVGLALNPATPLSVLDYTLEHLDLVLLMSVNPGFGGQSFIPSTLDKITRLRQRINALGLNTRIEVDGGISIQNIAQVKAAGADTFVAGSAIFGSDDYATTIQAMRHALNNSNKTC